MDPMDQTIVLFIVGGLATAVLSLIAWTIKGYETRISRLEQRVSQIELDLAKRLASIETKLEQLIER